MTNNPDDLNKCRDCGCEFEYWYGETTRNLCRECNQQAQDEAADRKFDMMREEGL
jgi:uncharacterized Zn ribbon protein